MAADTAFPAPPTVSPSPPLLLAEGLDVLSAAIRGACGGAA
ncbi:hypothetical protein [Streptomyces sp. SID9913]|nr:hypothetical protein [Streptomyces sp. SID9913]